jgi:hypothetical protein
MSEYQVKDHGPARKGIPVEFGSDELLGIRIKIQPKNSMNHPTILSKKTLVPSLFQIAACINDIKSVMARERVLALEDTHFKMIFDPQKLEAILGGLYCRKKRSRHVATSG